MRLTADTNLLVRIVTQDDAAQARIAFDLLSAAEQVVLPLPCLCELVWVLRKFYGFTSDDLAIAVRAVTDPYPGAFTEVGGSRLMVWWAETDSPAAHGRSGRPGEVLSVAPLVIATADGALELTKTEWRGGPGRELRAGQTL